MSGSVGRLKTDDLILLRASENENWTKHSKLKTALYVRRRKRARCEATGKRLSFSYSRVEAAEEG